MKCNLEQMAKVELTDFGLHILEDFDPELLQDCKIGKYHRMELYMLFDIFGDYAYHIDDVGPFVNNVIEIEESR